MVQLLCVLLELGPKNTCEMHPNRYAIGLLLLLTPLSGFSTTIHVPEDHPNIQAAIDAASDGNTIIIADGVYSGDGNINLEWDATFKHLIIKSENGRDHCIIDCREEGRAFLLNNGQDERDVIEGVTITNGMVLGAGGAIYIYSASPTIRNCTFINNTSSGYHDNSYSGCGGAIMVHYEASPILQGNILRDNTASNLGGGIVFAEYSSGLVENNIIDGNKALDDWGGGIALWNNSGPLIINNLIINNSCSGFKGGRGGGIYLDHTDTKLVNNTIAFNQTTGDEYGDGYGGGLYIGNWAAPEIRNCIIWHNHSGPSSMNIYFDPMKWLDISYCNVEEDLGHIFDLEPHTNIDAAPGFMDAENGNFQLSMDSPNINKGIPDTAGLDLPLVDLSGNLRIVGDIVDIGAYEFTLASGLEALVDDGDFILYPNPASGIFFLEILETHSQEALLVRIYDVGGKLVLEESPNATASAISIDVSSKPDGIYLLTVQAKGQLLYRQKIVKQ